MEKSKKMLIALNKKHSEMFHSQRLERALYLSQHPTNVIVFKCMDGRIHMPTVTRTPLGIMQPFRNIGGKFDLGWPMLNESFDQHIKKAVSKGNRTLVLVTYHFSAGDEHRGCAGFNYDCEESKRFTENFRKQILRTYGKNNGVVYPILVGLETDKDALIFHGERGRILDVSQIVDSSSESLFVLFHKLYPSMPERILHDLIPLVQGNVQCIKETMNMGKPLKQMVHGEWILAVGKGFDWLHTPNIALIVGPYDPNIGDPIKKAVGIIKSNLHARKTKEGFVLLSSAVYSDAAEKNRAKERTTYLSNLTQEIIAEHYADMVARTHVMSVIINAQTMEMEMINRK